MAVRRIGGRDVKSGFGQITFGQSSKYENEDFA